MIRLYHDEFDYDRSSGGASYIDKVGPIGPTIFGGPYHSTKNPKK